MRVAQPNAPMKYWEILVLMVGRHRHWPSDSDSPFRLRSNYAVPSGMYGHPASARRATAGRGRKLSALLVAPLFAASGAAQAKIITATVAGAGTISPTA